MQYLKRLTAITAEPITLEEAMRHLRVDGYGESPPHEDEPLITGLITAARELAEDWTGRSLVPATWEERFDCWQNAFRPRRPPVQSVSSVAYIDVDGAEQLLDSALWVFNDAPETPIVRPAYGAVWPIIRDEPDAVRVTYEAGPTDGESPNLSPLPRPIYQAMLLTIGYLYENREGVPELPLGARTLLHPYRVTLL